MSEREKITQTIILVRSLPELHPVPRKPLGISLGNQKQITTHHNLKRGDLNHSRTHSLFQFLHTQSEQPSNFTDTQITSIQTEKQLQENMEQITPDYKKITVAPNPLFNQSTTQDNLAFLNSNFHKNVF